MKTRLLIVASFAIGTSALTTGCDKGANLIASAYSKANQIETKLVGMLDSKLNSFLATPNDGTPRPAANVPGNPLANPQARSMANPMPNPAANANGWDRGEWNLDEGNAWAPGANAMPGFDQGDYIPSMPGLERMPDMMPAYPGIDQGGDDQGFNQGGFNQGGFDQGFNQGSFNQGRIDPGFDQGFNQGGFDQGFDQGGGWAMQQPAPGFDFAQHEQRMADQARQFQTYIDTTKANSDRNFQAVDNWTKTVIRGE